MFKRWFTRQALPDRVAPHHAGVAVTFGDGALPDQEQQMQGRPVSAEDEHPTSAMQAGDTGVLEGNLRSPRHRAPRAASGTTSTESADEAKPPPNRRKSVKNRLLKLVIAGVALTALPDSASNAEASIDCDDGKPKTILVRLGCGAVKLGQDHGSDLLIMIGFSKGAELLDDWFSQEPHRPSDDGLSSAEELNVVLIPEPNPLRVKGDSG